MSTILPSDDSMGQIRGVELYAEDSDPGIGTESDSSNAAAGVSIDGGSGINWQWIRLRNYVNKLRADLNVVQVAAQDIGHTLASDAQSGYVDTGLQPFAGLKQFFGSIQLGKTGTNGFASFFRSTGKFAKVQANTITDDRTIELPDASGTLVLNTAASDAVSGLVSTATQYFAGLKHFFGSIVLGKSGTAGTLGIYGGHANRYKVTLSHEGTADRNVLLPDASGALALDADKQNAITSNTDLVLKSVTGETITLTDGQGHTFSLTTDASGVLKFSTPTQTGVIATTRLGPVTPVYPRLSSITAVNSRWDPRVGLLWNFDNCRGIFSGAVFTMSAYDGPLVSIGANALVGLYLVIDGTTYKITANGATTGVVAGSAPYGSTAITIQALPSGTPALSSTISAPDRVHITSGASTYALYIKETETHVANSYYTPYPADTQGQAFRTYLPSGSYQFSVRAEALNTLTAWVSASFDCALTVVSDGDTNDGALGLAATPNGFAVSVSGWPNAQEFEIAYSSNSAGATFYGDTSTTVRTTNRILDVPTSDQKSYSVKVRPIASDTVVGVTKESRVSSGSGGQLPTDATLVTVPVNLRTYSGTFAADVATGGYALSTVVTPSGGSITTTLDRSECGSVLVDSVGHEFLLDEYYGSNKFQLTAVTAGQTPTTGTFSINTSKRGREVYRGTLKTDYAITSVAFDCDVKSGYSSVLQWFQSSQEASADALVVNANNSEFRKDTDITVKAANDDNGLRIFVIRFWDAGSSPENRGGVTGNVTVFAKATNQDS